MTTRARELATGIGFMLPALLITVAVFAYPLWKAVDLSLQRLLLHRPARTAFIGLDNYYNLLFTDPAFRASIVVTAIFPRDLLRPAPRRHPAFRRAQGLCALGDDRGAGGCALGCRLHR